MFKVLFLSRNNAADRSAYTHRIHRLKEGIEKLGVGTGILYLGEKEFTSHTMMPLYIPYLSKIMKQYDFIHAGGTPCAFVSALCKSFHGKKVIYDVHGDQIGEILQERADPSSQRNLGILPVPKALVQEGIATYMSDYFFVVSEPLKRLFVHRGVRSERIAIIRNGVDLNLFRSPFRNASGPSRRSNRLLFTYAGKFQPYQAVEDFVDAAVRVKKKLPELRFQITGFSPEDASKRREIASRGLGAVELTDLMPQRDLVRMLCASDVLVIPRRTSRVTSIAFPTKFAEYAALEKPVLVSRVDESAHFCELHKCGIVYGEGVEDLEKGILRISRLTADERKSMGRRGRLMAERHFEWSRICDAYMAFLKKGSQ
jgi:glycosyltransferase involved in cell wall biosynthesis